ncbi:MAG: hypothetical protein NTV43_14710 [Methylococcales bacterium]|nr:hypothetical protein [Methylococcales bacterium]
MQAIELQAQVIEEIKKIPSDKLAEIYDLIHYFRLGLLQAQTTQTLNPKNSFFEHYLDNPIKLNQFSPLSRDDIYE